MTEQHDAEPTGAHTAPAAPADDPYQAYVRRIVDLAPPLSEDQRLALRAIFHGRPSARAEAA